jgi:hypothetical protein
MIAETMGRKGWQGVDSNTDSAVLQGWCSATPALPPSEQLKGLVPTDSEARGESVQRHCGMIWRWTGDGNYNSNVALMHLRGRASLSSTVV